MWWRKPGDTELELSRYEGNESFLNKLAAPTNTSHKHYAVVIATGCRDVIGIVSSMDGV